jgi:hypothetical protein
MQTYKSDVPPELLEGKTASEKWMFNQQSIQRQQNEHLASQSETILKRLAENDDRLKAHEELDLKSLASLNEKVGSVSERIYTFEKLKERFTGMKTVIILLCCGIAGPLALAFIGAFFVRAWEKWIK